MAFRFKLQSVLDHRLHIEELAQNNLAAHLARLKECEEHLAWLAEELERAQAQLSKTETTGISAGEFVMANEYSTVLRLRALAQKSRIPLLEAEVEKARKMVILATKDRKVLEILKQRHQDRYQREQLLNEQRMLDEVAVGMYARRESQ